MEVYDAELWAIGLALQGMRCLSAENALERGGESNGMESGPMPTRAGL
jgi:hypothetical protein